jgi:mRNA interferase RelE/StbE
MNIEVRKSFEKDIEKITDKKTAIQINEILENLENCISLTQIHNLKKMKTKGNYYRIRVDNYRLGLRY